MDGAVFRGEFVVFPASAGPAHRESSSAVLITLLNATVIAHVSAYESDLSQISRLRCRRSRKPLAPSSPTCVPRTIRAFGGAHRHGQARSSVARKVSALRAFGRYLRREGWIEDDPAALAVAPRREQKVPAHLSIAEMSRLLEMPDTSEPLGRRDRATLELFYASGVRLSELVGLDLDDLDLHARIVRVLGKGGKERQIPFNTTAQKALRAWYADRALLRSNRNPKPQLPTPTSQVPSPKSQRPTPKAQSRGSKVDTREPLFVNSRGARLTGRSVQLSWPGIGRFSLRGRHQPARTAPFLCHTPPRAWRVRAIGRSATCNCLRRSATRTSIGAPAGATEGHPRARSEWVRSMSLVVRSHVAVRASSFSVVRGALHSVRSFRIRLPVEPRR